MLVPRLRAAGLQVTDVFSLTLLNTAYNESTYSYNLTGLIAQYVRSNRAVSDDELDGWLGELSSLDQEGAYFFSLNRYGFCAANSAA